MDNFKTTSSDACFALAQVISDSAQKVYVNKAMSLKAELKDMKPASPQDESNTLRVTLSEGK